MEVSSKDAALRRRAMDRLAQVRKEQLAEALEAEYRAYMGRVMEAVNAAPDGRLIEASEVEVNDLMNQFKERVYQAALQARIGASETAAAKAPAAFSPSGRGAGT
jgi:hypothetical protein